jgi:hypothetical protein
MSSIMRRRRRGNRCDNHILSGRRLQISVPPDLAAPTTRAQVALPISRHPGLGFRGSMAGQRGIKDGDVVRIYNSRGACLAGAVVIDTMLPGVVKLSCWAWYDPAEDGVVASMVMPMC